MFRSTSLHESHVRAGARMVDFAGWHMPVQYGSILGEVRAVREAVGVFDVSHMGQVRVSGAGALAAVQHLLTNNAATLEPGRAQYSLMCRADGGILDDVIVYRCEDDAEGPAFLIVVNASNREADFAWMSKRGASADAAFEDVSDRYALIAVQGPFAAGTLAGLITGCDLGGMRAFSHGEACFGGAAPIRLARTGYTGEDGFELFCAPENAPAVWKGIVEAGAAPCGLGARDVLRIEASYPLYGHEITVETNPYEAGLGWVVKPAKGDFVGREAMLASKAAGLDRVLKGVLPDDAKAIPRQGTAASTAQGPGVVTSGTFSPTLGRAIGMAYMPTQTDGRAKLYMRGAELPAGIVNLPFYKRSR